MKRVAADVARLRWPRVLGVFVAGGILSLALFWALQSAESDRIAFSFRRDANDRLSAFGGAVSHGLDTLVALDALYAATPDVERAAFRSFVTEHLLEEPGVAFLGWAPRVAAEDREEFESFVRDQTDDRPEIAAALGRFGIFDVQSGSPEPAAPRPEYFPVLHAEPPELARHTLGFDLASDPVQSEGLTRARAAHQMSASRRDRLRSDQPDRYGVLVFNPVYAESTRGDESTERLRGFLVGMFDVGAILDRGLAALEPRGIDMAVHDLDSSRDESLLHFHESRLRPGQGHPWSLDEALTPTGLGAVETVQVGDRRWLISCRPAAGYIATKRSWTAILALVGGLLLSGILAGAFFTILGREAETRGYAQDLLSAKQSLEDEAVQRERARADLVISEERFRRAFGSAPMGTATAGLDGRILQANPALCRMLQYEESQLLGMTIADITHPEDAPAERKKLERLVTGDAESVQYVERLRRRDQSEIWAELTVSLVRDADGNALYFVGQQQDITERRRASERLREARQTQERILDSLPLHVFLKDAQGRMQFLNATGRELLGLEPEDVVGKTDFDLFPEAEARALRMTDREVLETGRTINREETLSVGQRKMHLLSGKTRIQVEGSEEPYLLGFSIDLTPVKEAEEALVQSEYRFRQLVDNMSSGVAVYEAIDHGSDFVFRDYNRAAERIDGVPREEILGRRLTEAFPGAEEMGLVEILRNVWRTGEPRYLPTALYRDSRMESWRENYVYRLPSGEIVAIYDDVSERKRLETELLHAQKMEAVGRFAGGVAHDFNNLLQVVTGNIDLLLKGNFQPAERDLMLREVQEQAKRGTHLIRRLLVFSRSESYAPTAIDLGEVLRGAETLIRRLLKENIRLTVDLIDAPLPLAGDPGQLEQVLMNLIVNASDAMPEGGTLDLRSGFEGDREVWFSVGDSGPGIAEAMLDKIFDPYFTTESAAQGTGLGLAVVDGIVSLHGGRIEVDNRPGEGIEFRVVLPRNASPAETSGPEPEHAAALRTEGERVLVVEDQELVRGTVESMLGSLGYEVTTAADGGGARECASRQEFDLLVTDIVLPDITGVELAHELRAERPDLAVLLVSGYAEEAVRERGADLRFLQKPFRLEDLAQQAAAALLERPSRKA
ncbi:MAG: PAS domain S-box protein [bacterium]|nr:PAS domain S-box protein [bacterium]